MYPLFKPWDPEDLVIASMWKTSKSLRNFHLWVVMLLTLNQKETESYYTPRLTLGDDVANLESEEDRVLLYSPG